MPDGTQHAFEASKKLPVYDGFAERHMQRWPKPIFKKTSKCSSVFNAMHALFR
jgi:hypothetical protein